VNVVAELTERFGPAAAAKVLAGEVVCADGGVVTEATVLPRDAHVYLYRELPIEAVVPFEIPVLYRDDDIVVVTSRRPPWYDCVASSSCRNSAPHTGWTG
jgi:tRNA pseudouridine32 synthase/23S rRNA pseudouridine746 synthase